MNRREFLKQSTLTLGALSVSSASALTAGSEESLKTIAEIDQVAIRKFAALFHNKVFRPGDRGYESACQDWVGRITRRPGLVARCAAVEDVVAAVQFARERGLLLAVRGGGHSPHSTCEGGMLINLSAMNGVEVDAVRRVARAQAGLTVGELDRATCARGLATVLGECPSVGISGMGLGGGLGRLMGQHGALCDNLLSAEVVTADGTVLEASATENTDLFWGIRGGGGNFGIVTSFEYRLHPVGPVLAGTLRYPASEAGAVLRFFREWVLAAPDQLDALVEIGSNILQYAPEARQPILVINVCCGRDLRSAEKVLQPLRAFGRPTADTIRAMSYLEAQNLGDVRPLLNHLSSGDSGYAKRGFVARLADDAIGAIVTHCENPPSNAWSVALDHYLHGAVCHVLEHETAFSLRQRGCSLRLTSFEDRPGPAERSRAWVQSLNRALEPFSDGRIYLNYLSERSGPGVHAAFGANYPRLLELKKKYDPSNFFRLNPNIAP